MEPATAFLDGGPDTDVLMPLAGDEAVGGEGRDIFLLALSDGNVLTIHAYDLCGDKIILRPFEEPGHSPTLDLVREADDHFVLAMDGQLVARFVGNIRPDVASVAIKLVRE